MKSLRTQIRHELKATSMMKPKPPMTDLEKSLSWIRKDIKLHQAMEGSETSELIKDLRRLEVLLMKLDRLEHQDFESLIKPLEWEDANGISISYSPLAGFYYVYHNEPRGLYNRLDVDGPPVKLKGVDVAELKEAAHKHYVGCVKKLFNLEQENDG